MWVCGEIGYAPITCGRQQRDRLGDRPRTLDLAKHGPAPARARNARRRRSAAAALPSPTRAGKRSRIAAQTESSETILVIAAKPPRSAAFGSGRPRCSRASSLAATVWTWPTGVPDEVVEAESGGATGAVDEDLAVLARPSKTVDLVKQGRVADQGVRPEIGSRERISRSSMRQKATTGAPVRSEPKLGEGLGMPSLVEGGDREQLGRGDYTLPAASVEANLQHRFSLTSQGTRAAFASPCHCSRLSAYSCGSVISSCSAMPSQRSAPA